MSTSTNNITLSGIHRHHSAMSTAHMGPIGLDLSKWPDHEKDHKTSHQSIHENASESILCQFLNNLSHLEESCLRMQLIMQEVVSSPE